MQMSSQRSRLLLEVVSVHGNSSFCFPSVLLKSAHPFPVGRWLSFLLPEIAQHVTGCTGRSVLSACGQCFQWAFPPWQSSCPGGPRCASLRPPFFGTTGPQKSQLIPIFPEGESGISRDSVDSSTSTSLLLKAGGPSHWTSRSRAYYSEPHNSPPLARTACTGLPLGQLFHNLSFVQFYFLSSVSQHAQDPVLALASPG